MSNLETTIKEDQEHYTRLQNEYNDLKMQESRLQSELSQLKHENNEINSIKQQMHEKIQRLNSELDNLQIECDDVKKHLNQKVDQTNHLQSEIQSLTSKRNSEIQKSRQIELQNHSYTQDMINLKTQITHLQMEKDEIYKYANKYQRDINDLNADLRSLFRDFEMQKDQVLHEQQMNQQLKNEIQSLNTALDTVTKQQHAHNRAYDNLDMRMQSSV